MVTRIVMAEVNVICLGQRLRRTTQTKASIILAIVPKPISAIVLLCENVSVCKNKGASNTLHQRNFK